MTVILQSQVCSRLLARGNPQNFRKSVIPHGEVLQGLLSRDTPSQSKASSSFPTAGWGEAGLNGCTGLSEWETTLKA